MFGEQKTEWELAPAGNKFKERTRIANYTGLPELMSMFKQVADVRTADTLDLATPEMKYHIENIEATEFQKTLVQELSDRADDVQSGNIDPSVDNMLRITSDGRKLGLDPRLIDPSFEDSPDTKLNQCVRNVTQIYHDTAEEKLTQIIRENNIQSVTVVRMEVPCCGGLERAAKVALQNSGKFIPWQVITISIDGNILSEL